MRAVGEAGERILLVDAFAASDYPAPACSMPGMVAAAMPLADHRVLLMEEDPAKVEWLGRALGVVAAELHEGVAAGIELGGTGPTLLVLDPYSAGQLPLPLLRGWLEGEGVEALVRFPAADLRRLARYRGSALADLPLHVKRTVEGVSRLLGDARQQWLYRWTAALAGGVESGIECVAREYAARVRGERLCRHLRLPGAEGTEPLLLLTPRPGSILLLNEVVHGLREECALRWPECDTGVVRYPPRSELGLFGESRGPLPRERVVDRAQLADSLARRFAGRSANLEEVLRSQADTDLFAGDVRRALLDLRREGRAEFRSLGGDAEIAFAAVGARRMHHRPARKRAGTRQELSLALDG